MSEKTLEFWSQYNGRIVTVDGIKCEIRVNSYRAIYPYKHLAVTVVAEPTISARRTKAYRERRRELGDDWMTDVLQSEPELQTEILEQLEG